jgi:hypothetical protein
VNLKTIHTSLATIAISLFATAGFAQDGAPSAEASVDATGSADAGTAEPAAAEPAAAEPPAPAPRSQPEPLGDDPLDEEDPPMAPNAVYAELLGPGGVYSINYERVIASMVAPRIGISYLGGSSAGASWSVVTVPLTVSFVGLHSGVHGFEAGVGGALYFASGAASVGGTSTNGSGTAGLVTALAGYRLHPVGRLGFQFRAGFEINMVFSGGATAVYPWPYLSVGAGF